VPTADDVAPMAVTELVLSLGTLVEGEASVIPVEFDELEKYSTSTRSMSKSLLDSCMIYLNASEGAKGYSAMDSSETEIEVYVIFKEKFILYTNLSSSILSIVSGMTVTFNPDTWLVSKDQ